MNLVHKGDQKRTWIWLLVSFNFLVLLNFLLLILTWLGARFWFGELAISFLPQQVFLAVAVLVANCLFFWPLKKLLQPFLAKEGLVTNVSIAVSMALSAIVIIFGSINIYNFAWSGVENSDKVSSSLKVAVYNKLMDNKDFDLIEQGIREVDADVIGLIEVSPQSELHQRLEDVYPYQQIWPMTEKQLEAGSFLGWVSLFSKTELTNVQSLNVDGSPLLKAETIIDGGRYQLIAVHPLSPYSPSNFYWRDRQLEKLADFASSIRRENVGQVMIGDFNTSPWSPAYQDFVNRSKLANVAQGRGLHFTWDLVRFFVRTEWSSVLFQSQIDHIFVSDDLLTTRFQVAGSYGSDHNLVWAEVAS